MTELVLQSEKKSEKLLSTSFSKIISVFIFIVLSNNADAQLFKLASTISDLNSPVTCITLSFDGSMLITGDAEGSIVFRDSGSGKIIATEKVFNSAVDNMTFNSTGQLMIVSSRDGEIKIYDFEQKKFIQSLYSPDYSDMRFALFSIADGFIYFNGQGRLYKTRSDLTQPVVKIYECDSTITNAVITDDRSALIFTCGNTIKVLNTRTDHITQELSSSSSKIERLELSSGNILSTWSSDGFIVFRKYELNQLHTDLLLWFRAGITSKPAFSHDGNMMVTGNIGTWARIWKPFEKIIAQELFGHKDVVTNSVFSTDDQTLFTASNDKTIKVWKQKVEEQKIEKPIADQVKVPDTLIAPVVSGSSDSSMPTIGLDKNNIPTHVGGRNVDKTTVVEVGDSVIDIFVFDNSTLDGDVMSLCFQNQWILTHYEVTKKKRKIIIQLKPDSNNYLVLFADNLGKTPPNTAAISFEQNGRSRIFRLESDLKMCSAINFIYKPK